MFKYLASAVVAASLFGAPMLATSAEAAQTVKIVTQPAKVVIVKHNRFTRFHGAHIKHVRVWHPKAHVAHVRHRNLVIVKKPVKVVVKKTIITR